MIGALLLFAQLSIVTHAPDTVAACEAIELSVAVHADGQVAPQLIAPSLSPFEVLRSSIIPHLSAQPGQGGITAEFRYVLATEQTGVYTLAPFEARLGGTVIRSRPIRIVVSSTHPNSRIPTIVARARVDTGVDVNFRALTSPETVYVGQQANYEVAVFLNESVRDRLRRNPTFYPPDMQSMLAYDVPSPQGDPPRRRVGTRCFDALVYQRALFPLMPGRLAIPPAQLTYSLALSSSFFSREESRDLQTDSTIVVAVEPPYATRPRDYTGAVGDLNVRLKLDTTASRVGDPMLLTVRVAGTGNVKLFPRPRMNVPWASLVPAEERVQVDSTSARVRGAKEFDWVLTPHIAGEQDLPPVHYSYFNPDARKYMVAATASTRVHVGFGSLAPTDTATGRSLMALRAEYTGGGSTPAQQPLFWLLMAAAPIPALTLGLRDRKRRMPSPAASAASLRALTRSGSVVADACGVRRAFFRALAERLGLNAAAFARTGALARSLRRAGVSSAVAASAERFARELDEAAFSPAGKLPGDAANRAAELFRSIDREALQRTEMSPRITMMALVVCAGLGLAAGAFAQNDARAPFVHGVSEYYGGHYSSARDAFATSAAIEPRSASAWANLGTAAWAAGDTARAVAGWQRALILDPLSGDVRARLELVHSTSMTSAGYVAPVPISMLVWLAALSWIVAWGFGAVSVATKATARRRTAVWCAAGGIVLALLALELSDQQDERRLAVVRVDSPLSTAPALGTEPIATAGMGEIGRITGHEGSWVRVSLDNGREGWLNARQVIPLESAAAPLD